MVYKITMVSWRELRPNGVFDSKAVFFILIERSLRKPPRCVNLERIRVLAWLQVLAFGELHNDLFDRDDLLHLLVVIFECNRAIGRQVTSFDTFELKHKLGGIENLCDLDVNRASYRVSSTETQHVIVAVDIDGAADVQVQGLVPEYARVRSLPRLRHSPSASRSWLSHSV